jgi:hypothetical protein
MQTIKNICFNTDVVMYCLVLQQNEEMTLILYDDFQTYKIKLVLIKKHIDLL